MKTILRETIKDLKYLSQFEKHGSQVAFNRIALIESFLNRDKVIASREAAKPQEHLKNGNIGKMKKAKLKPSIYLRGF